MSVDKIILEAENIPRVDIDFMNNTHFDELVMVQEVGQLISDYQNNESPTDDDAQKVTLEFEKWIEHTKAHFNRENALMKETSFPMYHVHLAEHERVFAEMLIMFNTWTDTHDIEALDNYVFSAWPNWFNNHVNSMDSMTAQFAVMNGFNPTATPSL